MKKLLSTILIIALIMCMTACVNKNDVGKTTEAAKQTEVSGNENSIEQELNVPSDNDESENTTEDFDESITDVQSNDEFTAEEEMTEGNILHESASNETIAWWDYADNPFALIINDVEYHFPMSYDEFINMGWTPKDDSLSIEQVGEMLVDGDYPNTSSAFLLNSENGVAFKTDGLDAMWLLLCNRTGEEQKLKDCQIIGIHFNDVLLREYKIQAGVIKVEKDGKYAVIGQTTLAELCEYFGEPLFHSMSGESELEMTYYYDDFYANYNWATYLTSDENGVVQRFNYCCSY